ncbi:hypothetical protein AGMMS49992_07810 [Clostridia bacterium]|nr:hypothetical protein AGMMS49992_07810 [Clostridia bacterium]
MTIFATVLGLLALSAIGIPRLLKSDSRRVWIVYGCIFALAGVFAVRYIAGTNTSGPLEWLMHLTRENLGLTLRKLCGAVGSGV